MNTLTPAQRGAQTRMARSDIASGRHTLASLEAMARANLDSRANYAEAIAHSARRARRHAIASGTPAALTIVTEAETLMVAALTELHAVHAAACANLRKVESNRGKGEDHALDILAREAETARDRADSALACIRDREEGNLLRLEALALAATRETTTTTTEEPAAMNTEPAAMTTEPATETTARRAATATTETRQHIKALEVGIVRRIESREGSSMMGHVPPIAKSRLTYTAKLTDTTRAVYHLARAADKGAPVWPRLPESRTQWETAREAVRHAQAIDKATGGEQAAELSRAASRTARWLAGASESADYAHGVDTQAVDRAHAAIVAALKNPELARELGRACANVASKIADLGIGGLGRAHVTRANVAAYLTAWAPHAGDSNILDPLVPSIVKMIDASHGNRDRADWQSIGETHGAAAMRALVKVAKR